MEGRRERDREKERERERGMYCTLYKSVPHPALSCTGLHSRVSSGLRMLGTPSHEHAAPCIGITGWTGNQSPPTVYSSPAHPSYPYRARRRHTHPPPPNVGTSIPPYYGHGAGRYERCATPHAHALGHPYPHPLSPLLFPLPSPSQASQASQTRSQSLERVPAVPLEPSPASGPQWSASLKVHRSFFPSAPSCLHNSPTLPSRLHPHPSLPPPRARLPTSLVDAVPAITSPTATSTAEHDLRFTGAPPIARPSTPQRRRLPARVCSTATLPRLASRGRSGACPRFHHHDHHNHPRRWLPSGRPQCHPASAMGHPENDCQEQ